MSSGRCTKESAIQSTARSAATFGVRAVFSFMAETGMTVSGRLTPLRERAATHHHARHGARAPGLFHQASAFHRPGSAHGRLERGEYSGCGSGMRVASPGAGSLSSVKSRLPPAWPRHRRRRRRHAVSAPEDRRECRQAGGKRFSSPRSIATISGSFSRARWLMLRRKTSAPVSKSRAAMPSVRRQAKCRDDLDAPLARRGCCHRVCPVMSRRSALQPHLDAPS